METIHEIIRKQEQEYTTGKAQISEYVDFSVKDNVDRIDAYLNSRHISGKKDSLGRDKPFFNIVTAAVNVWYRATDIDRANIRIRATKSSHTAIATLANIKSQQWMRDSKFGTFLNDWGRTLARYGSAVLKFVERDGKLTAEVVPWNRLIIDNVDFESSPKIEKFYYTASQLRKNKLFDQDQVESLIDAVASRKTLGGQTVDSKNDYIEVYEIHGEFEREMLTGNEEDEDYVQQVHICSFLFDKETETYLDYTLYKGQEEDPYMITHLIKEDGRSMSIGAVEHLFEAQWMVNFNEKAIKDQLELASKLIFQTSDPAYQGKNTHALDTGSILYHEANQPLTQLANNSHDITSLAISATNWRINGNEQVSTPDAIKGNTMPSSTAARQVEALQQESHSLFELMTENKGLAIEEMWRRFVIPHLKKQLDTKEEMVATLEDNNIKQIDSMYIPNEAKKRENERIKKEMFKLASAPIDDENLEFPAQPNLDETQMQVQNELKPLGNQRFFAPSDIEEKTWKEAFKDFEWECEVEVTNEAHDKLATLTSLTTVFRELANMGDIDNARMVLSKVLEESGVFSPMELMTAVMAPKPQASTLSPEQLPPANVSPQPA